MSGWFQVRIVEGEGASLRVPIVARSRSLANAYRTLVEHRRAGFDVGLFQPTRRDGADGRWWQMPRALS